MSNKDKSAPPVIEVRGLESGYGGIPVIRGIDFKVHAGEIVVLLGANGAGKSTTLLTLAGELPVSKGEIIMDGVKKNAPLHVRVRRGLAFVPEERSVFRGLSCMDNLRVGMSRPSVCLEIFPELERRLGVRGGLLSGGEQQMLSLGRALSLQPRLLLVDELSLGLAPLMVKRLLEALRSAADAGCGVVLVEQHVRQALGVADVVHVLRRGEIVASGTQSEMQNRVTEIEQHYLSAVTASSDPT